ncbi:MAG: hypothetical protein EOP88_20085 [Verrucomicrobiaceae bacterium]|nr:MAG: hypothetical protein EOP88_20085 [Verrucomicrobiaceae bacterium]
MPSRWYRSRLFLSGLAGLVMLLTAWGVYPASTLTVIHYTTRNTTWSYVRAPHATGITHRDYGAKPSPRRMIRVTKGGTVVKPGWLWSRGWETGRHDYDKSDPHRPTWFSSPPYYRVDDDDWKSLYIANWLIATTYLVLWTGALVLWQRRKRRMMQPHDRAAAHLESQQKNTSAG